MPAIPESQARTQYILRDDHVVAYSLKCASTFLQRFVIGRKIGQFEAMKYGREGGKVLLIVRHPLDRLVSNYEFWRRVNSHMIPCEVQGADRDLMGDNDTTIEQWYEASEKYYNPHWCDQSAYHTHNGVLVPNVLYPFEVLGTLRTTKVNASPRKEWEEYFSPEFRAAMEERFADDIALYERAQAEWDGKRPRHF